MVALIDREHESYKIFIEKAIKNVEIFRCDAQMIYSRYSPSRRLLIKNLTSNNLDPYDVLAAWSDDVEPTLGKLEASRSSLAFNKSISKYLQTSEKTTQQTIDQIIDRRIDEVSQQFINRFESINSRAAVSELIYRPIKEINVIKQQYIQVSLVDLVAKEYGIKFVDPHSSLFRRLSSMFKIRRERKLLNRRDKKRLNAISLRLEEIKQADDGLIGEVLNRKIDLISILASRTNFEKRIEKLSIDEAIDAATRLEIFYEETRNIRHEIMNSIAGSAELSLESVHTATKLTDKLLLRIFDLTNTQKNNLLMQTKEYRELSEEHERIIQSRKERQAVIG